MELKVLNILFKICIVLLVGIIGGRIAHIFKLPNVSGYLVAGLFLGPSFFKLISSQDINSFSIINDLALAAIAFSIGSEFVIKDMLKLGKSIVIITIAEVIGAIVLVFSLMFFVFKQPFAFSIIIASMSAATAPAATLLVIRQYKADGPLTRTILPVVALDDVFGIIAFGIALSLARMHVGQEKYSIINMIGGPFLEIGGSLLLGVALGLVLVAFAKRSKGKDELQGISLVAIGIATGLSNVLGFSPLLTCIVMGTTLVNMYHKSTRVFESVNDFISPIYILFFTLAGASLNLKTLSAVGLLGLSYIVSRAGGKMIGAWIGAKSVKADPAVTKYLGLGLLPQGGISIGLMVLVNQHLPQYSEAIGTIIMFSVLVYEVSGPIFAKIAIEKAGEINGVEKKVKSKSKIKIKEKQKLNIIPEMND